MMLSLLAGSHEVALSALGTGLLTFDANARESARRVGGFFVSSCSYLPTLTYRGMLVNATGPNLVIA